MSRRLPKVIVLTTTTFDIFLDINPVPASRPRVTRWGVFYGKRYETFRRDMREIVRVDNLERFTPLECPIECRLDFILDPPKTVQREVPRGDIDNFCKGPLDSLNGILWKDDMQIVKLTANKRFKHDGETSGIRLRWWECNQESSADDS